MSSFTKHKQTHKHKKQTNKKTKKKKKQLWLPQGKGGGGINWSFKLTDTHHTTIYKTDKQQVPIVQHGELYSMSCNNL